MKNFLTRAGRLSLLSLSAAFVFVAGCNDDNSTNNTSGVGQVVLMMHDAPVDDFKEVWLTVESVTMIGDDDSNSFSEIVQDENAIDPYEQLEDKTVTGMLEEMVTKLDPREATILRFRFGLDGGTEKTLEEVGEKFGVTRERVRQIQNIALRKMRKMIEKFERTQR